MRTRATACLAAFLLLAQSGCAAFRARQDRAERLRSQLDALRYAKPLEEVWQEVRRLLADRDYPLAAPDARAIGRPEPGLAMRLFSASRATHPLEEDAGLVQKLGMLGGAASAPHGLSLETDWRRSSDRYRADALEDGGVRILFTRFVNDATDRQGRPERDLGMELALAQRVDPDAAARIEAALAAAPR